MKYLVLISTCIIFYTCTVSKPKEGSNESVLAKLDSINSWYNRLVIKQYRPIYVFETGVYNKAEIEIRGNIYDYYLVEEGKPETRFETDFINRNLDFAKAYLKKKQLNYSKVYLQVPIKKEGFSRDIVSAAGKEEAVISKLTRKEFFFDNSIASLVDSKRYSPNFTVAELPKDLINLIVSRFEQVKTFVPDIYKSKIINSKLIISESSIDLDPSKLFIHNVEGNVKISSLLVRAILVKAISQEASIVLDYAGSNFKLDRPVQLLKIPQLQGRDQERIEEMNSLLYPTHQSWESTRQRFARFKKPEIEFAYRDIINTINSTLDFLFLHEFSHIYLGPNMINEYRADCYGYATLKKQIPQINFGVFSELMVKAIENKGGYYWITDNDSIKIQQIIDRYKRVKKIDSLVDKNILTTDVQCDNLNF